MHTLNLVNQESGTINYELIKFSDSQILINLKDGNWAYDRNKVIIVSRGSWEDLQKIIIANQVLKDMGFKEVHLYLGYMLGARSDRKFSELSTNYLKNVICPVINSQKFASVSVVDAHSHCTEMGLKRFEKITNGFLTNWALAKIKMHHPELMWLIPDKGAAEKARNSIVESHFKGEVVYCDKERDIRTGTILRTTVNIDDFKGSDIVIVDDICDGGATFIEIAKAAKQKNCGKAFLIITHGIFSKGFAELSEYFEEIYCTNSIKDITGEKELPWIHQLNIFE